MASPPLPSTIPHSFENRPYREGGGKRRKKFVMEEWKSFLGEKKEEKKGNGGEVRRASLSLLLYPLFLLSLPPSQGTRKREEKSSLRGEQVLREDGPLWHWRRGRRIEIRT